MGPMGAPTEYCVLLFVDDELLLPACGAAPVPPKSCGRSPRIARIAPRMVAIATSSAPNHLTLPSRVRSADFPPDSLPDIRPAPSRSAYGRILAKARTAA